MGVVAVDISNPGVTAVFQRDFCTVAWDAVNKNWACSLAKVGVSRSFRGTGKAQYLTNNGGIVQVPRVITDGTPATSVVDFHSAGVVQASRSRQTQRVVVYLKYRKMFMYLMNH